MSSLYALTLTGMLNALAREECSVDEVWQSCRQQVERLEPAVRAWQQLAAPEDTACCAALPLKGLPIGVKDTIDVLGLRAERGSPVWHGRQPLEDAACVSLLKQAGARVMGKTVTTEFAYFTPGVTANPHRLDHTPGGSSSGSAAAVAAGMVPLALGSQTAASVIRPAAYCGVAGFVASAGAVSLRGVMPLAHTLDAWGVLARDVADLQCVHTIVANATEMSTQPQRRKPRAVLALDGTAFGAVDDDMRAAHAQAVEALASRGITVEADAGELLGPDGGPGWIARHSRLMAYEAAQTLAFEYANHRDLLSPSLRALVEEGQAVGADHYEGLKQWRDEARQRWARLAARYDAVLAPAAPGAAPRGLEATGRPDQSRAWQLLGVPQVTLPAAWRQDGLPLGLQLVGAPQGDRPLLQVARWLQDELGWLARIPGAGR